MAKGLRKFISLDQDGGENLVEVDIKCSNPQMMLKAGLVHPDKALEWAVLINKDRFYEQVWGGEIHFGRFRRGMLILSSMGVGKRLELSYLSSSLKQGLI